MTEYIEAAMEKARYEILSDDHSYYREIPGFQGVYGNGDTLGEVVRRTELREVHEKWGPCRRSRHATLPTVDGIQLKIGETVQCPAWDRPAGQRI